MDFWGMVLTVDSVANVKKKQNNYIHTKKCPFSIVFFEKSVNLPTSRSMKLHLKKH